MFGFHSVARHRTASVRSRSVSLALVALLLALTCLGSGSSRAATFALLADSTLHKADRALHDGEYATAERLYREVLADDPRDISARCGLSYTLLKSHRLREASEQGTLAVTQDPTSARAHAILGMVILGLGDFPRALTEFKSALNVNENTALAIAGVALIDFYENRTRESLDGLRRASFLSPDEPDFVFQIGQIAARTERYKEAADAYERFLRIAPRTDSDRRERIKGLIDFLRYLNIQGSLYIVGGDDKTSVPFRAPDSRPLLDVRVNGNKKPLNFVLDTGSGMSVISEETAKRLGVRIVARGGFARGVGGPGRFEIVYGFLDSLEIGGVKISNVPVYVRKFYTNPNIEGYIGLSVISKFAAVTDYKSLTFTLQRHRGENPAEMWQTLYRLPGPNEKEVPKALQIPIRTTSSGFLSGEVQLQGVQGSQNFIIDTGASISVVGQGLYEREALKQFARADPVKVYGSAGVAENVTALLLPSVSLGPHQSANISAAVLDLDLVNETTGFEQTGILGGNFLRNFRVTFDFVRGYITLEPNVPRPTGTDTNKGPESPRQT
jgi:predicted aspartyl protease/Tfp pilus assembly protein PilF